MPAPDGLVELWSLVEGAAATVDEARAYVVRYNRHGTGGELHAVSLQSRDVLWSVPLQALGGSDQGPSATRVQLGTTARGPVVYGWETAGRYIELRDGETGALVGHQRLEVSAALRRPLAEVLYIELMAAGLAAGPTATIQAENFQVRRGLAEPGQAPTSYTDALQEAVVSLNGTPAQRSGTTLRVTLQPDGLISARWEREGATAPTPGADAWSATVELEFVASHGWGHVYRLSVHELLSGAAPTGELRLEVHPGAFGGLLDQPPKAPVKLSFRRRVDLAHGPPSGTRDADGTWWELTDAAGAPR